MANKPLTMADIFDDDKVSSPDSWDVDWINKIKIPNDVALNQSQATKIMTETARAVEWCGDKIAFMLYISEKAKADFEKEWSEAYLLRSKDKTASGKKVEADGDAEYLAKKAIYARYKSFLEYFKQKQSGFLTMYNAMREILRSTRNELPVSNWITTDNAYPKTDSEEGGRASEETPDENFDL